MTHWLYRVADFSLKISLSNIDSYYIQTNYMLNTVLSISRDFKSENVNFRTTELKYYDSVNCFEVNIRAIGQKLMSR